jgi:uncharacterized protein YqgC (DUF456 family)
LILIIIIGLFLAFIGLAGCILPVIPGPTVSFLSLIVLSFAKNWEPFSTPFLVMMAIVTIILTIMDYVVPTLSARKFGASKIGMWGSIGGMAVGLLLFPPWGVFLGAFAGAIIGELLAGKKGHRALRVGWGVFVGNMIGIGLKLAYSGFVIVTYMMRMF